MGAVRRDVGEFPTAVIARIALGKTIFIRAPQSRAVPSDLLA
jgi:hypothetical protein